MPLERLRVGIELAALAQGHRRAAGGAALAQRQRVVGRDQPGPVRGRGSDVVERLGLEELPNHRREERPEIVHAWVSHPQ